MRYFISLILLFCCLPGLADDHVVWPLTVFTNPNQPNTGIYWFADNPKGGDYQVMKASIKTATGNYPTFFDPNKPTFIYFHGWQPNSTKTKFREDFFYSDPYTKKSYDTLTGWKQRGWNVGIFYWNQFADEGNLQDFITGDLAAVGRAEAKIYTNDYDFGTVGMRWAYLGADGKRHYSRKGLELVPVNRILQPANVTQIAFNNYWVAMHNYQGPEVRFAGHSLGGQLVISLAGKISNALAKGWIKNPKLMPTRIALLDPYFSPLPRLYLYGNTTAQKAFQTYQKIMQQHPNTLFTEYRSSPLTQAPFGNENIELEKEIAYQRYFPLYISFNYYYKRDKSYSAATVSYLAAMHNAARFLYYNSIAYPPPLQENGEEAMSATTSNTRIKEIEGDGLSRIQIQGLEQFTPKNHLFLSIPWSAFKAKS